MAKCSFCNQMVEQGRGIIFVEISGRILNFCSSKCKKLFRMKRQGNIKWVTKKRKEQ